MMTEQELVANLADREWRLNNLYMIQDKQGRRVQFEMNWAQRALFKSVWFMNLILKARQLGFTTFICILFLDAALFTANTKCGIIAHTREDAESFFDEKIKFAYDNLPIEVRAAIPAKQDTARKLKFVNGSSIRTGTSLRSGTFQYLHISEFGKICAQYPHKAKEIVTGALNTVDTGQYVFIESTAEGQAGYFYDYCQAAQNLAKEGRKPNKMQFRFFFYAWWQEERYTLDPATVLITTKQQEYFQELKDKHGINLTAEQKAWYAEKSRTQGEDMYREYPSTPEEAFKASIEGAYYSKQMAIVRKRGQICRVPYQPGVPVNTGWDLGLDDSTTIWFHQRVGQEDRLIDYYENSGEGLAHYVKLLQEKPYIYGTHFLPHDAGHMSLQTKKTTERVLQEMGLRNTEVVTRTSDLMVSIDECREFLPNCWFDEEKCSAGIASLDAYRKEWDDKRGVFKSGPRHDWACHGADGFRSLACGGRGIVFGVANKKARPVVTQSSRGWT